MCLRFFLISINFCKKKKDSIVNRYDNKCFKLMIYISLMYCNCEFGTFLYFEMIYIFKCPYQSLIILYLEFFLAIPFGMNCFTWMCISIEHYTRICHHSKL